MSDFVGLRIAGLLAALLLVSAAHRADAQTVKMSVTAGRQLTIEMPAGFCHIDPNGHEADRRYFSSIAEDLLPENKLLAFFADCPSVEAYRNSYGKGRPQQMQRRVQIMAPLFGGELRAAPSASRSAMIDAFAKLASADGSGDVTRAVQDLKRARPGSTVEPKVLGLLAKDDVAAYSGVLARDDEHGKINLIAGVQGMTLVGDYVIAANVFRGFSDRGTFDALISEARETLRTMSPANEK